MKFRNSTLPVLTVLTLIAVAGGFQLGETAIAQIDPLYFEGAAPPPRDVTQRQRSSQPNAYAAASGWEEGYAARSVDCGADCPPSLMDRSIMPADTPPVRYSDQTIEPSWEKASSPEPEDLLLPEQPAAQSRVGRYLHYPVSAEQAEIRAALDGRAKPAAGPDGP